MILLIVEKVRNNASLNFTVRIRGILKIFRKYVWTTDLKTDGMRRREK